MLLDGLDSLLVAYFELFRFGLKLGATIKIFLDLLVRGTASSCSKGQKTLSISLASMSSLLASSRSLSRDCTLPLYVATLWRMYAWVGRVRAGRAHNQLYSSYYHLSEYQSVTDSLRITKVMSVSHLRVLLSFVQGVRSGAGEYVDQIKTRRGDGFDLDEEI